MSLSRSAIVTVAFGHSIEHLDHTFTSFAKCDGVPLHAFILGEHLPEKRQPEIQYHLVKPVNDFSHPLREVYFRRMELIDDLEVDFALVVDSYDVLCVQPLPPFAELLAGASLAGCVEHLGCRYVLGQGYTANFINGGVIFWNLKASLDIRREIIQRARTHFRTVADDQWCLNEVVQTKYYNRLRILPCQYNFRSYLKRKQRGWPTVDHLDGVVIYHNATCMDEAKKLLPAKPVATLPDLESDGHPLTPREQFWRRLRTRLTPHVVK
ncbi:MAG: hypothetical protein HZA90_23200 [Verrucomicrobia bacterium]|nr:hypothetical protein [Verrucomicrobiota bacterium]